MLHKTYDRFPYISAAGKIEIPDGLTTELKDYTKSEIAKYSIEQNKLEEKLNNDINKGIVPNTPPKSNSDTVQTLIETDLNKFRFKEFEENFYEDLYYKSAKAGRTGQPARIGSKPDHVSNTSRTFGKIDESGESAYNVICPRKKPDEVLREQQKFHDKYILSNKSYFPSEQVRRYPKESFDPTGKTFGRFQNVDISGKYVKNALVDCSIGKTVVINNIQDDYIQKNNFRLGKAVRRQNFNHPEGLRFGSDSVQDKYSLSCLVHNTPPSHEITEILKAISYLSNLRIKLKNKVDINLTAIEITLRSLDIENSLRLDWMVVFQVLSSYFLYLDQDKIKLFAKYFKIVNSDNKVKFVEFLKFLDSGIPLPKLGNLMKSPSTDADFCTTYREFANDINRNNSRKYIPPTGVLNKEQPSIPKINETDVGACISPSIPTQFGLSHSDYLKPRNKDEIHRIFRKVLKNIDDKTFDKLYNEALHLPTSLDDKASVDAFKCCLIKYRKKQAIKVFSL